MGFCKNKMVEIFSDFKNDVDNIPKLCILKELRYDSNNVPEYSKDIIQRLYLLRYFPAYLSEYYIMYKDLLKSGFIEDNNFNIISLGCGSGIDCYSMMIALTKRGLNPSEYMRYTGIDYIPWLYFPIINSSTDNYIWRLQYNLGSMEQLDEENYNVIVFPKSIGEFSADVYDNLLHIMENTNFTHNRLACLCSFRDSKKDADISRFEKVIQKIIDRHGYTALDERNMYTHYVQKDEYWHNICPEVFEQPEEIVQYLINILGCCSGYVDNNYSPHETACERIAWYPIKKVGYAKWRIIRLER